MVKIYRIGLVSSRSVSLTFLLMNGLLNHPITSCTPRYNNGNGTHDGLNLTALLTRSTNLLHRAEEMPAIDDDGAIIIFTLGIFAPHSASIINLPPPTKNSQSLAF